MKLIGMLDSPYVRRVAISLQLLGIPFEHLPLSVFSAFDEFSRINPAVKAPTLVCDDGTVLCDSGVILEYAEALSAPRTLRASAGAALRRELALVGMSLVACEKAVQILYERNLRPDEKRHEPWIDRVRGQLRAACAFVDAELAAAPLSLDRATIGQAAVTSAVAWHFARRTLPDEVLASDFPHLEAHSARAESLPEFRAAPHGPGRMRA